MLGGIVDLGNEAGRQALKSGFGTLAEIGQAPRAPTPLLPPPDLSGVPRLVERLPLDAPIPAIPGASAYRTQMAPDQTFAAVYANELSHVPRLRIADLPDGEYVARVRGVDPNGLEGFSTDQPITIHARPEPPVLVDPAPDAGLTVARPTLRWAEGTSKASYHVQISTSAKFETPLADVPALAANTLQLAEDLAPGVYYWRVSTIDTAQGQGPFSDAQSFRRLLPGPGIDPPKLDGDQLTLRWLAAGNGASYHLQLARDENFQQPFVDEVLSEAQYALKKPAPGSYFLRVNAISADGFAGPWGATQTLSIPDRPPPVWRALLILIPVLLAL